MDWEPIVEEEMGESLLHRTATSFPAATANSDNHYFINGTSSNSNGSSSISSININKNVSSGSGSGSNNSVVIANNNINMSIAEDDEDSEDNGTSDYYFSLPVDFGGRSLEGTEEDGLSLEYSGSGDDLTLIGEEISISSNMSSMGDDDKDDDDDTPTTTDDENTEANEPTGGEFVAPEELLFGSIWVHHPKHGIMVRRSVRLLECKAGGDV